MLRVGMLIEPVFRDGVGIPGEPVAGTVGGNCHAVLDPQRRLGDPIRPPIDVFDAAVRQYGPLELILSEDAEVAYQTRSHAARTPALSIRILIDRRRPLLAVETSSSASAWLACLAGRPRNGPRLTG